MHRRGTGTGPLEVRLQRDQPALPLASVLCWARPWVMVLPGPVSLSVRSKGPREIIQTLLMEPVELSSKLILKSKIEAVPVART